jgi:hypothetical protein
MKKRNRFASLLAIGAGFLLSACGGVHDPRPAVTGSVTISIAAPARTLLPTTPVFSKYDIVIPGASVNDTGLLPDALNGGKTYDSLPAGNYVVTVTAYQELDTQDVAAAKGSANFSIGGGTTNVPVTLRPLALDDPDAEDGVFTYTITLKGGVTGTITIGTESPEDITTGEEVKVPLEPGYYDLSIVLTETATGLTRGFYEALHIYSGLLTEYTADFSGVTFTANVPLAGTVSNGVESGTVKAYSSNTQFDGSTLLGTGAVGAGGAWRIELDSDCIGADVYVRLEGYPATLVAVEALPAKGKAGIVITGPVLEHIWVVGDMNAWDTSAAIDVASDTGVFTFEVTLNAGAMFKLKKGTKPDAGWSGSDWILSSAASGSNFTVASDGTYALADPCLGANPQSGGAFALSNAGTYLVTLDLPQKQIIFETLITYTALADGSVETANSTAITLTFSEAVALEDGDVSFSGGDAAAKNGAIGGSGNEWTIPVSVSKEGAVTVAIAKTGVASAAKTVAVHKYLIPYGVAQSGGTVSAADSTGLAFTFDQEVSNLTAGQIQITGGTGSVTAGELAGSGTAWTLGITVSSQGTIQVAISHDDIVTETKEVTVYKAGAPNGYTALANGSAGSETSTAIVLTFEAPVESLALEAITLANVTGEATKTAIGKTDGEGYEWTLTISGVKAGTVTVTIASGSIVSTATEVTVHEVEVQHMWVVGSMNSWAVASALDITGANGVFVWNATLEANASFKLAVGDKPSGWTAAQWVQSGSVNAVTFDMGGTYPLAETAIGASTTTGNFVVTRGGSYPITVNLNAKTITLGIPASYNAQANGVLNTTASDQITFTFERELTGLSADDITIEPDSGTATKGVLNGSGTTWTLGISAVSQGTVSVSIDNANVDSSAHTVSVYAYLNKYEAAADGEHGTNSTTLTFTFDDSVAGLEANDITISSGTTSAEKGLIGGSGTTWTLGITPNGEGTIYVSISKAGIETTVKPVTIYKADALTTWIAEANGSSGTEDSTEIVFNFSSPVVGLTAEEIDISNDTGSVVKGDISGGGSTWTLGITTATEGTVSVSIAHDGVVATSQSVMVYKVLVQHMWVVGTMNSWTHANAIDVTGANGVFVWTYTFSNSAQFKLAVGDKPTDWNANQWIQAKSGHETISNSNATYELKSDSPGSSSGTENYTVTTGGLYTLTINLPAKTLSVVVPLDYVAAADGDSSTDSTYISLTFAEEVDLSDGDITLGGAAEITTGSVEGTVENTVWTIPISLVSTPGSVTITINKTGISSATKTVTVYKAGDVPAEPAPYDMYVMGNATPEGQIASGLTAAQQMTWQGGGVFTWTGTLTPSSTNALIFCNNTGWNGKAWYADSANIAKLAVGEISPEMVVKYKQASMGNYFNTSALTTGTYLITLNIGAATADSPSDSTQGTVTFRCISQP